MKSTHFILGSLIGGIIGATAAILLAPSSGTELRDGIKGRIDQIRAEVIQAGADRRAELEEHLASLRQSPPSSSTLL